MGTKKSTLFISLLVVIIMAFGSYAQENEGEVQKETLESLIKRSRTCVVATVLAASAFLVSCNGERNGELLIRRSRCGSVW